MVFKIEGCLPLIGDYNFIALRTSQLCEESFAGSSVPRQVNAKNNICDSFSLRPPANSVHSFSHIHVQILSCPSFINDLIDLGKAWELYLLISLVHFEIKIMMNSVALQNLSMLKLVRKMK